MEKIYSQQKQKQSNIKGKLTGSVQDLCEGKYKTLSNDIKENLNIYGDVYIYIQRERYTHTYT